MNLQEVLSTLIATEDQAGALVEEARRTAASRRQEARRRFAADREARIAEAREQASTTLETARTTGEAEAAQILQIGARERSRMEDRFRERVDAVIASLALEIAVSSISKSARR